ncbi:MAG: RNA polymerase sigma factor [Mucilaginibacter sp.]
MKVTTNQSELWVQAATGSQDAYALLHKSLYSSLYHYLLKMVKEEETADDIVQDVFVKLWTKKDQIGYIKNVKAYFFTVARSMAINHFRQQKIQTERLEQIHEIEIEFNQEEVIVATEANTELKQAVATALNNLPARQREILYLKFYEDMDYYKIVEVTGIRYQSVVNHVFRAIQTLRAAVKQKELLLRSA